MVAKIAPWDHSPLYSCCFSLAFTENITSDHEKRSTSTTAGELSEDISTNSIQSSELSSKYPTEVQTSIPPLQSSTSFDKAAMLSTGTKSLRVSITDKLRGFFVDYTLF